MSDQCGCWIGNDIHWCALHGAAKDLLEAAIDAAAELDDYELPSQEAALIKLRAAIAKALGDE